MEIYVFGEILKIDSTINKEDIKKMIIDGKENFLKIQSYSVDQIIDVLSDVGKSWEDPEYKYRKNALEKLPDLIGFSSAMIEEGIKTMTGLLKRKSLEIRLDCDLGNKEYLDSWIYNDVFDGHIMAQPLGIVAHISAGNVFVGAVDTLVQGIVTKNINIMKMSSVDPVFPILFARSIMEHDKHGILSGSIAMLHWKGGTAEIEDIIKKECDALIVYGGAKTVESFRSGLGLHTKIVEYGPKYSFILLDSDELIKDQKIIENIARDIIMWEQSACSSPHVIYFEDNGFGIKEFSEELGKQLNKWHQKIPQGKIYEDEAVEITRIREVARIEEAMEKGALFTPGNGLEWTIVVQKDPEFTVSCHNRTIFVKPLKKLESVTDVIKSEGKYIQTVSIVAEKERSLDLGKSLIKLGADRIVGAGRMAVRKHGTPHDGTLGLAEFVRWASCSIMESEKLPGKNLIGGLWKQYTPDLDSFDYLEDNVRQNYVLSKVQSIVRYACKNAELFRERYKDITIDYLDDMKKLPFLSGNDMKDFLPPGGKGILTDDIASGYVFSSGGTTGKPKGVYRTHEEQHFNAVRLGKGLALSVFQPGDTVANLLFSGNMWASFVSYNMALEHTGCRILPIAGNLKMEDIVDYLRTFKADAAISIPSVLLSLAGYVEKNNIKDIRILKVSTGGEHLFMGAKKYLNKILGVEKFASTGYTTNDTGAIAYQCEYCSDGIHHVHEDLHYVEILDQETNKPVHGSDIGKIIVTNLQRKLMPTIRYDVGDLGRWIDSKCKCGRKTKLMELLGRSDEVLIIGGGNIHPEVVAKAVHETEAINENFQMVAKLSGHLDQLLVRVEMTRNDSEIKKIKENLKQNLLEHSKELRTMFEKGLIADVAIEVLESGGRPRNPRTGKIKLTSDERK